MLVSYNWLKEYIDLDISPRELASIFDLYGLPVEDIIEKKIEFTNVINVNILDIQKHPNADKLTVCKVTDGKKLYNIVCGAKNIQPGNIVPLAKNGATLPGNIKIKIMKIRDVESCGMLCSAKELGLNDNHSEILILDPNKYKIGDPFMPFTPDYIFNLEITPNRPDLLCIIGIARFLSILLKKKIKYPKSIILKQNIDFLFDMNEMISIEVKNKELCPRYTARIIKDVKVMDSPEWLKERLQSSNIRPINNIVDVTNYILLEMNQPLHAFDYSKIEGKKIIIRNAYDDETIKVLDGKTYKLKNDNLIIADDKKPIAIAGIMGGEECSIDKSTNTIILESAFFNPKSIRKTSKIIGLASDSSYRFERGIDIENVHNALNRATELIIQIAGGKTSKNYVDIYPQKFKNKNIVVHYDKINRTIGLNLSAKKILSMIKEFNFKIKNKNKKNFKVQIPGYRIDINQEIDLIEEIAQMYGYENISNTIPVSTITIGKEPAMKCFVESINNYMISYGFYEVINYSFLNNNTLNQIGVQLPQENNSIFLKNPFNEEEKQLKTNLITDILKNLITNYNKENENIHLFEIGKIYIKKENNYLEQINLCCISSGEIVLTDYNKKSFSSDFYYLKSVLFNMINELTNLNEVLLKPSITNNPYYDYYSNILIDNNVIGQIGKVKEEILYKNKIKNNAFAFEINLNTLFNYYPPKIIFKKLSVHPIVKRDISIIVAEDIPEYIIERVILNSDGALINNLKLIDLYKGEQIPVGYKSLTYSLILQSPNKTLTENEINELMYKIINNLKNQVKAELRS